MLSIPTLECERLLLAPLSHDDSEGMFALWSRTEVCRYSGPAVDARGLEIPLPATRREDSDRLLDYWLERARSGTGFRWALHRREGGAFVGAVGFNALGRRPEYAFHLVPESWGEGLASEASRRALVWVAGRGAREVEAYAETANRPSLRLLGRLGFVVEGEPREGAERHVWRCAEGAGPGESA